MSDAIEDSIKKIIENANEYKNQLILEVQEKIDELVAILQKANIKKEEQREKAKALDVKFSPDMSEMSTIEEWIKNLQLVKNTLEKMEINTEDNLFAEEKYLKGAQEILNIIAKINFEDKISAFKEQMIKKIEAMSNYKIEDPINLEYLKCELEGLEYHKNLLKIKKLKLQDKNSRIKILKRYRRKINEKTIAIDDYDINNYEEKIENTKSKIDELEERIKENHYLDESEFTQKNQMEIRQKDEDESR